jgi:hypothetical protein
MIRDTTKLEYILSAYARPSFLAVFDPDEDDDIQIVISCNVFDQMDIEERIDYVFNIIKTHASDLAFNRLIIVQAYDSEEMVQVIENAFKDSNL